jgi:hypothetical protein
MTHRTPLLFVLGGLSAGLMGYFLFFYDDAMAPKWVTPAQRTRKPAVTAPRSADSSRAEPGSMPLVSEPPPGPMVPDAPATAPPE